MTGMPHAGRRQAEARAARVSEKAFMEAVVEYATLRGFLVYHTQDSRHSARGYPDLCLCRPPRIIFAELKTVVGRLTPDQERWLGALGAVPSCEVHVWRPTDECWVEIERAFR